CGEMTLDDSRTCPACRTPLVPRTVEIAPTEAASPTLKGDAATVPAPATPADAGSQATASIIAATDQLSGSATPHRPGDARAIPLGALFATRYLILSLLGQGGMGRVYAARDRELDKVIALKTVKSDPADTRALQRFKHELILARKVTHKNVVRIYD